MLKNNVEVNKLTISIRTHIKLQDIAYLLDSASRGSAYWSKNFLDYEENVNNVLYSKGSEVTDLEADEEKIYLLDIKKVKRGLTVMAKKEPSHFSDFIKGDFDQITGDVFLQCCLFGEVIYS